MLTLWHSAFPQVLSWRQLHFHRWDKVDHSFLPLLQIPTQGTSPSLWEPQFRHHLHKPVWQLFYFSYHLGDDLCHKGKKYRWKYRECPNKYRTYTDQIAFHRYERCKVWWWDRKDTPSLFCKSLQNDWAIYIC